ncbi:MAG: phosphatidylinositol-specific phospholipase C [Bacilli bacterium]|nr:phosphatidylinositol-specific phospholipase C [Bacilli bacterium]MBQ9731423.1 phosphatidylinositol-specific phospholipase C [Bacilli bacterium]
MLKKNPVFLGLITLASTVVVSVLALVPITKNKDLEAMTWMSKVDDNTPVTELSIPGTHDSGATRSIFDVSGKCQDTSIETQLNIGVRFFDIRLQLVEDDFRVVHSFVDQKLEFEDVLEDMVDFVEDHKSEFLIMSIKEEADSINERRSFEEEILDEFEEYKDVICYDNSLPATLKEARGKIYILSRFNTSIGIQAYGGWQDSTSFELNNMYIQDNYCINDVEVKQKDILDTIEYSKTHQDKLVLNFTSCYDETQLLPPLYAGTPALTINPWLEHHLTNEEKDGNLGIMIMDFMTLELSRSIYRRNI